ncbi:MAG: hypothetical protein L6Q29_02520 [Candidatus Pacebacteria bacterium]|nr:hypothetical protein [Candidatus Paceibacterota bacterium]NUQ57413.1 hypothetical protein [Candidatus Paceibacter sp.]
MSTKELELEKEASKILKENGFMWDGRKKEEVGKTIFLKPQTGVGYPRPHYK